MTDYIEDPYMGSEYDEIFNDWYEIEGERKIKELSRQLRTFFNYKAEVIRYRFRISSNLAENFTNTKFISRKKEIESLTHDFITLLKRLKKPTQTLEEGIRSLFFNNDKACFNKLSAITEKLSMLLHYFSEESLHNHPKFLKFSVILVQHLCLMKKCLNAQFSEFFEELEINYNNLEEELEDLIEITPIKKKQSKKQFEERLTS
ncbi:MAG: hypothetical protein CEE42_09605 [Promethearchaeota archaeon Loki_b31]|nr:MAG: hypothetical protein CEE42_09605 [Candidatus Lokiarchaeota archaeon Loki_b31]